MCRGHKENLIAEVRRRGQARQADDPEPIWSTLEEYWQQVNDLQLSVGQPESWHG